MKMADINLFPLPTGQFIVPWGALASSQRARHNSPCSLGVRGGGLDGAVGAGVPGDGAGRAPLPERQPSQPQHIQVGPWPQNGMAEGQDLQVPGATGSLAPQARAPAHEQETSGGRRLVTFRSPVNAMGF